MERWSVQHRIAAVELFIKTESVTATQRGFRQQFQRRDAPSRNTLLLWVSKWRLEGSVKDSKPQGRPRSARTPDNVERVRDAILRSPRRSARRHALALRLKDSSVRRILHKDLHYHPYKIQVAQELSGRDKVSRLQFCNEFMDLVNNNRDIVNTLLMSDEAHFHMSGYVNKQNCRYWAPNNPHELHQRPLHSAKVTVWCAISSHGVIGPYFFENSDGSTVTVNAERYKIMLETFLQNELRSRQLDFLWFQQDGATAHTARTSMTVLRTMFPGRLISRFGDITWPARSPDLAVPDYFLWGYVKSKVYETRPANIDDLKQRIRECTQGIPKEMLQRVMTAFPSRLQECIERHGGHLQSVIFKQQ